MNDRNSTGGPTERPRENPRWRGLPPFDQGDQHGAWSDPLALARGLLPGGLDARQLRLVTATRSLGLRRGDLIFGNRLSPVHRVLVTAGDTLTHSAVVGLVDGELRTIELGPVGVFSRSIEEFTKAYRYIGVARLAMSERCVAAVAASAEHELAAGRLHYSWSACSVAGAAALLRRAAGGGSESRMVDLAGRAAAHHLRRDGDAGLTCSGFVVRNLRAACPGCRPTLVWPLRDRTPAWRGATSATDVLPGRWSPTRSLIRDPSTVEVLWTPSDVWVADRVRVRSVVRPDHSVLVVDLVHRAAPIRCAAVAPREEVTA